MTLPFRRKASSTLPLVGGEAPAGEATAQDPILKRVDTDFFARLAEEVWRLDRRAKRASALAGEKALQGVRDSAERLRTVLADNGIEVQDHSGEAYREGSRLTVLHVEEEASGDQRLWISETVRPTVLIDGVVHDAGHVILTPRRPEVEGA